MNLKNILIIFIFLLVVTNTSILKAAEQTQNPELDNFFNKLEEGASELGKTLNEGFDIFLEDGRKMLNDERWDQMLEKSKDFFKGDDSNSNNGLPDVEEDKSFNKDPDQEPVKI